MLNLTAATYRHPVRRPTLRNPWATEKGPGIRGIDLNVGDGIILGMVGPNGAGKTTLMRIIAGLLPLEDGSIELSRTTTAIERRAAIGFMPEQVNWAGPGTAALVMSRLCAMRGLPPGDGVQLLDLVGLSSRSEDDLSTLSQGMRQRLSLATTLLGEPNLLLLDEPLNGLDPVAQSAFRILLRQLAERGTTVIISSHGLADLERLADEIVLMHQGRVIAHGPLDEIERDLGLAARLDIAGLGEAPANLGDDVEAETIPTEKGEDWAFRLHLRDAEWTVERRSALNSFSITRLQPVQPELESVISAATGVNLEHAGFAILSEAERDA